MRRLRVHVVYEHGPDLAPYGAAEVRLLRPLTHPTVKPWLELSFGQAVGVMGVLAIGILLPAGAGLFGSFQLAVTLALQLFFASEIVNGVGSIYVFLLFVVQAVGIVLAGVVPLLTLKVRLADLMPRLDGLSSEGAR